VEGLGRFPKATEEIATGVAIKVLPKHGAMQSGERRIRSA
jgi:hypothetical protein